MSSSRAPSRLHPALPLGILAVAAAGALSGVAIGESRPLARGVGTDLLPQASPAQLAAPQMDSTDRPPDHYPLVTPDGTIPVAELALHGRLRDRLDREDKRGIIAMDTEWGTPIDDGEMERLANWSPRPSYESAGGIESAEPPRHAGRVARQDLTLRTDYSRRSAPPPDGARPRPAVITVNGSAHDAIMVEDVATTGAEGVTLSSGNDG